MIGQKLILLAGLSLVAMVCCSCSSGGDSGTTQAVTPPDPSKMVQTGAGGVKARSGGGVAGLPEDAKPGEKVGAPPAGNKSGGG